MRNCNKRNRKGEDENEPVSKRNMKSSARRVMAREGSEGRTMRQSITSAEREGERERRVEQASE